MKCDRMRSVNFLTLYKMRKISLVLISFLVLSVTGCSQSEQLTEDIGTGNLDSSDVTSEQLLPVKEGSSVNSPVVSVPRISPVEEKASVVSKKITYKNDKYGFSIDFPDTWKGYTVTEKNEVSEYYPREASFSFDLGGEMLFAVGVFTKEQFANVDPDENPIIHDSKIAENASYVFTAVGSQDNSDFLYVRRGEVEGILDTFKAY